AEQKAATKRARDAERKRRQRANVTRSHADIDGQSVTATDTPSPKKETSPTPPKEKTTPSQSEPNGSSKNPRAALEAVLDAERAGAVLDHRQRIRKPLTSHGAKLLAGKFALTADPNAAADAMIANGWQGFEREWLEKRQPRGSPSMTPREPRGGDAFFAAAELVDGRDRNRQGAQGNWPDDEGFPVLLEYDRQQR